MTMAFPPLFSLVLLLTLLSAAVPLATAPASPSLFVLGDSAAICSSNTFLSPLLPHSLQLCNHSLLPDLIARKMGLPPLPPFFEVANDTAAPAGRLLRGANFGSQKGTVLVGSSNSMIFQGMHRQLTLAFDAVQMLQLELGRIRTAEILASAVFYLSFGKDDYVDLLAHDTSGVLPRYGRRGFRTVLVPQIVQAIEELYNAGVRKIVVVGVVPLGCAPQFVSQRCLKDVNELILHYNKFLSRSIQKLMFELPGAMVVFCDVYKGVMKILSDPPAYGFEEVRKACCGRWPLGCLSDDMACDAPSSYVWWDAYSPTEAVNSLLADWSWSGKGDWQMCEPITVEQLVSAK